MHGQSTLEKALASRGPLRQFLVYFLRLGTLGFGGPIALAGYMQRDLVEERKWVTKQDYLEGLASLQLSPGPLAAQLAMYLGWVRAGRVGATLGKDWLLWMLFSALVITTVWAESEIVWLFVLCEFVALFVKAPPRLRAAPAKMLALIGGGGQNLFTGVLGPASA